MFDNKLKTDAVSEAIKKIMEADKLDEISVQVPTKTGTIVYGGAKGGSAKAYKDQHGIPMSGVKGPSDKELKAVEKEKKKEVDEEVESLDEIDLGTAALVAAAAGAAGPYIGSKIANHFIKRDIEKEKKQKELLKQSKIKKEEVELDEWKVESEWKKRDPEDTRPGLERAKALSTLGAKKAKSSIKDKDFKEESEMSFAERLIEGIKRMKENKGSGPKETFTDNNMGEDYQLEEQLDQEINEVLSKNSKAGTWIHDFVHSDNPKFAGKSQAKRKEMALAAYYAKQRNEDVELQEEYKEVKVHSDAGKHIGTITHGKYQSVAYAHPTTKFGGSKEPHPDEDSMSLKGPQDNQKGIDFIKAHHKDMTEAVDPSVKTTDTLKGTLAGGKPNSFKSFKIKLKEEEKEKEEKEGHEDEKEDKKLIKKMVKSDCVKEEKEEKEPDDADDEDSAADKAKDAKEAKKRGMTMAQWEKSKEDKKQDKEEMDEERDPPFEGGVPAKKDVVTDKSGAKHTPMSRVKDLARAAMKKVKTDSGQ